MSLNSREAQDLQGYTTVEEQGGTDSDGEGGYPARRASRRRRRSLSTIEEGRTQCPPSPHADDEGQQRPSRRRRKCSQEQGEEEEQLQPALPELSLQVKWTSMTGRQQVSHLHLQLMESCEDITGLHKRLVARVFSDNERPPSFTNDAYFKFNTCDECLNYPVDIASTSFRLVAMHDGWSYVIHEARSQGHSLTDFLHVVSIEFETVARVVGQLGIRMSMIAYPIIAINKAMLLERIHQLQTDPNFKGIL